MTTCARPGCGKEIPPERYRQAGIQASRVMYCSRRCTDLVHEANRRERRMRLRQVTDRKPVSITVKDAKGRKRPVKQPQHRNTGAPPPVVSPKATPHKRQSSGLSESMITVIKAAWKSADQFGKLTIEARNPDISFA